MGAANASPDIKADADAQGNVKSALQTNARQKHEKPTPDRRNLLERIFNPRQSNQQPQPQSAPPRAHWPF
jgi:hypothetical protein